MRAPEFWGAPPGLAAGLLTPLSIAWTGAARLRRGMAHPYRAPIPVVCVGNLVAGGSGKTPVVLSLAAMAAAADCGAAVHIVTRGYGGRLAGPVRVDPARHDAADVGDEALLLAACAPCWLARDRAAGIAAAAAAGAELVILDDGFQNPTIAKDVSLVVVDAEYGFGNGRVMPAGPLREPVASGLARADAVVLLGDADAPDGPHALQCPVIRASLAPVSAERFRGARVVAFAGIGRPQKFFATLRAVGAEIVAAHAFPDHHPFADRDLAGLRQAAAASGAVLVTTAKDWARLPPGAARKGIGVLHVEVRWRDRDAVVPLLARLLPRNRQLDRPEHGYDRRAAAVGG